MRKTLCAAALVLALCGPAFAGVIPNPSGPQPPTPSTAAGETVADGDIPNPSLTEELAAQTIMGLIESVLALL
jgi:hypothetical protein